LVYRFIIMQRSPDPTPLSGHFFVLRGDKRGQIAEGHGAVIFVDLTLDSGARLPMQLRHRFTFHIKGNAALGRTINDPIIAVAHAAVACSAPWEWVVRL
jgi:hypothetical protein